MMAESHLLPRMTSRASGMEKEGPLPTHQSGQKPVMKVEVLSFLCMYSHDTNHKINVGGFY